MPIENIYVLPHGSMALEPQKEDQAYWADIIPLQKALQQASDHLIQSNPEVIVIISPHAISLNNSHAIFTNKKAYGKGDAEEPEKWDKYFVSTDLNLEISQDLLTYLRMCIPGRFDGITQFSTDFAATLGWGEIFPLFLSYQVIKPKLVVLSVSSQRQIDADKMAEESFMIGGHIYEYFEGRKEKVAVVVSADLAHTHKIEKGPQMGKEPYGVEQCAEYFDKNCEKWAKNPTGKINLLLENNRKVVMKALSCGYLGLVMATGMMKMHEIGNKTVKSYFLERRHPTYFGMMVSYYELQ